MWTARRPLVLQDRGWPPGEPRLSRRVGGAHSLLGPQPPFSTQCPPHPCVHVGARVGAEFPGQPRPPTLASCAAPAPRAAPGQGHLPQGWCRANFPKTVAEAGVRLGSTFLCGGFCWALPRPRQAREGGGGGGVGSQSKSGGWGRGSWAASRPRPGGECGPVPRISADSEQTLPPPPPPCPGSPRSRGLGTSSTWRRRSRSSWLSRTSP